MNRCPSDKFNYNQLLIPLPSGVSCYDPNIVGCGILMLLRQVAPQIIVMRFVCSEVAAWSCGGKSGGAPTPQKMRHSQPFKEKNMRPRHYHQG
jgi:hypothetical protein